MLRYMLKSDIEILTCLAHTFMKESGLGVAPDSERIKTTLETIMEVEGLFCRVWVGPMANINGVHVIGGFYIAVRDQSFYEKPWLMMQEFYVIPECRGAGKEVGSVLVADFLELAEKEGCSHAFAASTAKISPEINDKFVGLFKKYGFDILGPTLVREME